MRTERTFKPNAASSNWSISCTDRSPFLYVSPSSCRLTSIQSNGGTARALLARRRLPDTCVEPTEDCTSLLKKRFVGSWARQIAVNRKCDEAEKKFRRCTSPTEFTDANSPQNGSPPRPARSHPLLRLGDRHPADNPDSHRLPAPLAIEPDVAHSCAPFRRVRGGLAGHLPCLAGEFPAVLHRVLHDSLLRPQDRCVSRGFLFSGDAGLRLFRTA